MELSKMSNRYRAIGLAAVCVTGWAIALISLNNASVSSQINRESHLGRGMSMAGNIPTLPGQDAFGAIQEIVGILEADPATDWNQVNLVALREHLIDMHEVTLNTTVEERKVNDGLEILVTGTGRTQAAIQRLVPNQAKELNQLNGWRATTASLPEGVRLIVTSEVPSQVERIRALGFAGLLVSGGHHQQHHLAIARGMLMH